MSQYSVVTPTVAGVAEAYAAVTSSDTFHNNGRTILAVKNGGATGLTVTVESQVTCNQGFSHDLTVAIAAGATKFIGPFNTQRFNDARDLVEVGYSATASVTAMAMQIS